MELSDRESEVLALIARGLTNGQIAEELYLSVETVKTYVKRLYAKLEVHNRAQAAVAASTHQLTPRGMEVSNVPVRGTPFESAPEHNGPRDEVSPGRAW